MGVLLTGQHSCGILTHRINGCAADGSAFLWNTNPQDRCAADGSAFLWNTNPQDNGCAADGSAFLWNTDPQ